MRKFLRSRALRKRRPDAQIQRGDLFARELTLAHRMHASAAVEFLWPQPAPTRAEHDVKHRLVAIVIAAMACTHARQRRELDLPPATVSELMHLRLSRDLAHARCALAGRLC